MTAARVAAWQQTVRETQRGAELEQQAARDQAREARDTAEQDKRTAQEAFRKKGRSWWAGKVDGLKELPLNRGRGVEDDKS